MDYVGFEVTGVDTRGRRFKLVFGDASQQFYMHAMGINLYRGSVWARKRDGSRKLLRRVWN